MRLGIAGRFAAAISLLVLFATYTVGYLVYRGGEQALIDASTAQLAHTAEVVSVRFDADMEALGKDVHFLAETPPVQGIVRARLRNGLDPETSIFDEEWGTQLAEIFKAFLESRPSYLQIRFIGVENGGRELVRVDKIDGEAVFASVEELQHRGGEPFFEETLALPPGGLYFSDVKLRASEATWEGIPVLHAASPIYTTEGEVFGLVAITVDFQEVSTSLQPLVDSTKALYIANGEGELLLQPAFPGAAHTPRGSPPLLQERYPQVEALLSGAVPLILLDAETETGAPSIAHFSPLSSRRNGDGLDLVMGVTEPHSTILAGVRHVRNHSVLLTVLFSIAGIALALSISGYLTRPLRQITRATSSFGRGEHEMVLPTQRTDEIGILARAFEAMVHQIQEQISELEDEERRQRTILETSAEGIIVADAEGTIETFNAAAEKILGYSAREVTGLRTGELIQPQRASEENRPGDALGAEAWMSLGRGDEAVGCRKDGSVVPLSVAWSRFQLGREEKFTIFLQDISERKRAEAEQVQLFEALEAERASLQELSESLEQRVRERTADLTRVNTALEYRNRELQDFAFVASHDLQEPLRKLRAFADLLRSDHGDRLDEAAQMYVERIYHAAERMSQLIADLLSFSRTTAGEPFEEVDLNRIVQEVLCDFEAAITESGASVSVQALPTIEADPAQMRQLFQNLIGNALKFHREGEPPSVEVRAVVEETHDPAGGKDEVCRLEVTDDGIGFDEKYLDRIFSPFQRLHSREAFEGTGMGLTICRRIVERHNGSVTARSVPEGGTTFIVMLPVRQASPKEEREHTRQRRPDGAGLNAPGPAV